MKVKIIRTRKEGFNETKDMVGKEFYVYENNNLPDYFVILVSSPYNDEKKTNRSIFSGFISSETPVIFKGDVEVINE